MRIYKLLALICSTFLFTACSSSSDDDDNDSPGGGGNGGGAGGLEITLEDAKRHAIMKIVSHQYYLGEDIGKQLDPGAVGKGVTWDFSGIDLSKYILTSIVETEGAAIDYSTSPYKDYYPDATECYLTKWTTTELIPSQSVSYSDYYSYEKGNITYGGVQDNTKYYTGVFSSTSAGVYTPGTTETYPQYLGVKYTIDAEATMFLIPNGNVSSFDHHVDFEVDGEGTVILPNGKIFTDVLRRKNIDDAGKVEYHYISKQAGDVLRFIKGGNSINFRAD
ncbi:MAG: hypothetical protein LBQ84_00340 [Flavobacteriaceae bacterium]|jgi:hypothetical protein|nr:hypothetical protein [Flavobacteriaceae bacterium]